MSRSVNLQRRHFEYIADTLLELKGRSDVGLTDEQHAKVVAWFAHKLASTNFGFKHQRFYDRSCGIPKARPVRVRKSVPSVSSDDTNYWE